MSEINTLTVNGKAYELADAAAREALGDLGTLCTGFDGTAYANAGEAIRKQVEIGASSMVEVTGKATKVNGYWVSYATGLPVRTGSYFDYYKIKNDGYKFIRVLATSKDGNPAAIAFYATEDMTTEGYMQSASVQAKAYVNKGDGYYTAPVPDGCKLIVITSRNDVDGISATIWADANALRCEIDKVENLTKSCRPIIKLDDYLTNPSAEIKPGGNIMPTDSVSMCVSEQFFCCEGDVIKGRLSSYPGNLLLAIYDKNGDLVSQVASGSSYDDYIDFEHTFTAEEYCFRISGASSRKSYYFIAYTPVNSVWDAITNSRQAVAYNFSDHIVKGIAHGGYSQTAPENTIAAYKVAKQNGFSFVECDTHVTADGVIVLLHDTAVDRTSNGTGNITDMTFEEARALDFGSWKSEAYAGEKIPTFEEFIIYCRNAKLYPYIEVKYPNVMTTEKLQEMVDIVHRYGMARNCSWISFNKELLTRLVAIDPTARVGRLLYGSETASLATGTYIHDTENLRTGLNDVFINAYWNITAEGIEACRNAGMPVEVWTVDDLAVINQLDPYISGVTSNWRDYEAILLEASII